MGIFKPNVKRMKAKCDVEGLIQAFLHGKKKGGMKYINLHTDIVFALAAIGAPAVEPLLATLKDVRLREDAAHALGHIRDARAVEPLIALLEDKEWTMRREAVQALSEIKRCTGGRTGHPFTQR